MNIVLAHNYYGSAAPSGENTVFLAETELLRRRDHRITVLSRHSDEIRDRGAWGCLRGALSTPWNPFSKRDAVQLLRRVAPDVFHVHNCFPLLSPAVFYAARGLRTANILTLHNCRAFCAAGIPMRGEKPCTECLDSRSVGPALRNRCYRDSLAATLPLAAMIWLHRALRTWEREIDAFIALTDFQRDLMCGAGLPEDRVFVKPNFYPDPPASLPFCHREAKAVFIGRLGVEKGCHLLLEAWRRWGPAAPRLEIIGAGSERSRLEASVVAAGLTEKIAFRGQLSFPETQASLALARLLLLPSLCFEGFPMVVREAFALGVPVAASRLGSMPGLIEEGRTGTLFEAGDPGDLVAKIRDAWSDQDRLSAWGAAALEEFEKKYTSQANYRILMRIYRDAMEHKRMKLSGSRR